MARARVSIKDFGIHIYITATSQALFIPIQSFNFRGNYKDVRLFGGRRISVELDVDAFGSSEVVLRTPFQLFDADEGYLERAESYGLTPKGVQVNSTIPRESGWHIDFWDPDTLFIEGELDYLD